MNGLEKFDHIGIVVKDLEKTTGELSRLLGLECRERVELNDVGVGIAFYPLGEGEMELIQFKRPIDGIDPIVTQPSDGVQHIAFQVENLDRSITELVSRGLRLVKGFPREGAHGMVAFFYPIEGLNLLIEICEHKANPAVSG